jgi:hypothetical protein
MNEKKVFFKVKSALMMKDEYVVSRNPDGTFNPSEEFSNMIADSDDKFRSAVLTFIDDVIQNEWAVRFTPFTLEKYEVRVYCESVEDFNNIKKVIIQRLPNEKFQAFLFEGKVSDIGNLW